MLFNHDSLVYDRREGGEGYAVKKPNFERMYEQVDEQVDLTAAQQSYIDERITGKIAGYTTRARNSQYHY